MLRTQNHIENCCYYTGVYNHK